MTSKRDVSLLIVAAGKGLRVGGDIPKQFRKVAGKMLLSHALSYAGKTGLFDRIAIVRDPLAADTTAEALAEAGIGSNRVVFADGGKDRQASVLNGLEALAQSGLAPDALVLVHDAARPFLPETVALRIISATALKGAAIPVLPVADTLAYADQHDCLAGNAERAALRIVQTPQGFCFGDLLNAHRAASLRDERFTDDASLMRAAGQAVALVEGHPDLFKITHEADFARAEHLLGARPRSPRTGIGYDVHAFTSGDHVMLGGISVPHDRALLGHSDADPVLHAITDALLGCIGDGDIGMHFPPSDPQWRGAASSLFLEDAARRVRNRGGVIMHIDTTIVCEAPKIGPHRNAIQARIAQILQLSPDSVGVKATTSERLGFTGRKEGIAALASATIMMPETGER